MAKIGVGLVGASVDRGWSARAHIPSIRNLSADYELVAISTTEQETADHAAQTFGVKGAYTDNRKLVEDSAVDLVVVTVKVPLHREVVDMALRAGKHVYCEWPLGRDLAEAIYLQEAAEAAGVKAIVGLQARMSPWLRFIQDKLSDGYVGRILSTSVIASGRSWGPTVQWPSVYLLERSSGATMMSIPFGHFIDAMCVTLGEFSNLQAILANGRTHVRLEETGEFLPMTTPDQVLVNGKLRSNVLASVHYRGGLSRGTNFLWEINGEDGDLLVEADSGHIQMMDLRVRGARGHDKLADLKIPSHYFGSAPVSGSPANVERMYAALAQDLRDGGSRTPTFGDAAARHATLDAIKRSADSGQRQRLK